MSNTKQLVSLFMFHPSFPSKKIRNFAIVISSKDTKKQKSNINGMAPAIPLNETKNVLRNNSERF